MKIILKYIFTNVKERKSRTAVMLLSIILSSMLLLVSFSIGESYERAQQKMARGSAGSATISVSVADGQSLIQLGNIPDLPSIGKVVGMLETTALYHEDGYYETFDLLAANISELNKINPPRLADKSKLADFLGYKIVLPDRFASKYKVVKGDIISLQISGEPVNFEVAQIAAYDTVFLRHTRGSNALLPLSTLTEILGKQDGYSKILIEPAKNISTSTLKSELLKKFPAGHYQVSATVNETQITADARQKSMPFFLISFFALTMSVFIIYSSYKVITLERLPIIGTFRSIGATEKIVTRILVLESLLYGGVGGLLGIPVGIVASKFMLQGLGQSLSGGIQIPVIISTTGILLSLAVAIGVSILSALLPIRSASRLPVKDVVLGIVEEKQMPHRFLIGIGVLLFIASVVLPKFFSGNLLYLAGGFSLLGLIVATIIIIPLLTSLVSILLERIYGCVLGNEGKLAARNMRDNRNITQNITLLFISISAVIAISMVGNFVTTYISDVFDGAEMEGFADGQMEQSFVNQVEQFEGVEKVLPIHVMNNKITADGQSLNRMEATDNLDRYSSMFALSYTKEDMKDKAIAAFAENRTIILSEDCMNRTGFKLGDTVMLKGNVASNGYFIAGSFKSRANDVEAIIPSEYAARDFAMVSYGLLAYTATDPDAVMIQIRDLFGDTSNWSRTVTEFNTDALSTVGAFLAPMHNMTYFILLLATVGIINNLIINYIQKRRSIAMYKSIGLSNKQNIKMTLIEGFTSGLIGAAIAIIVSYMEIQTIFLVAGPKIAMTPELNIKTFFLAGAMGIVITLIGSVVPILNNKRMKLVKEIKFE